MAATVFLLWPLLLGQALFVEASEGECPSAREVEQRVRGILGLKDSDALEEQATLLREGKTLRIVVRRKDGSVLGEKLLDAEAACHELEGLASVVVATWISDVHPEFVATLPPAPSRAEMPGAESDEPGPTATSTAEPASAPAPTTVTKQPPATRATVLGQRWRWELGVSAGVTSSTAGATVLGSLGARWAPERLGLGVALTAHAMTPQTAHLSMGNVLYWRWPLVVGPTFRVPLGAALLEFHAGPALGWLHAEGRGFAPSKTEDVARGGGLLALRGAYGTGRWRGFLEASGVIWGKTEAFIERGSQQTSVALPTLELYATLGASWAP